MRRIALFAVLVATVSIWMLACEDSGTAPSTGSSTAASSTGSIDGSSAEAFNQSLEAMKSGLDEAAQNEFEIAIMALTLTVGADKAKLREKLDGKSAGEVIEMSSELK